MCTHIKQLLFIILLFSANNCVADKLISLPKVQLEDIKETGNKYTVDEYGEVNINGQFIKRIDVGPSTISFTFHNKTKKPLQPSVFVEAYNIYGMRIGSASISWMFDTIPSGEKHTETDEIYTQDYEKMFKYSKLKTDKDFNKTSYLILTSNVI